MLILTLAPEWEPGAVSVKRRVVLRRPIVLSPLELLPSPYRPSCDWPPHHVSSKSTRAKRTSGDMDATKMLGSTVNARTSHVVTCGFERLHFLPTPPSDPPQCAA